MSLRGPPATHHPIQADAMRIYENNKQSLAHGQQQLVLLQQQQRQRHQQQAAQQQYPGLGLDFDDFEHFPAFQRHQ